VAWHDELIAAGRAQTKRDAGNYRLPSGLVLLASVEKHTELVLDSLWNIEPMNLGVQKSRQTTTTTDRHVRRRSTSVARRSVEM